MVTKTFLRFFTGFLAIVGVAVGVLFVASGQRAAGPASVDIVAQPK